MKKTCIIAAAMAVSVLCGVVPFSPYIAPKAPINADAAEEVVSEGLKFTLRSDRAELTGCTDDVGADVVIPDTVEGYPVTAINKLVSDNIKSVTISDSVVTIDSGAFANNKNLVSVTFGKNVQFMRQEAFRGCESLKSVKLPDNAVLELGVWAFCDCTSLEEADLGKGLSTVGASAFMGCKSLKKVNFGHVEDIGNGAFNGCSALTDIVLPDTVLTIGESAFQDCTGLTSFDMGKHVRNIKSNAFLRCSALETVKFSEALTSIGRDAFNGCSKLKDVKLNEGVTSIDFGAFSSIDDLTIELPSTLENINDYTFSSSKNVTVKGYDDTVAESFVAANNEKAGALKITFVSMGAAPVIEYALGDVNADSKVDATDATLVLVNYALLSTGEEIHLTAAQKQAADINTDTKIDSSDATLILQYYSYTSTGGTDSFEKYLGK